MPLFERTTFEEHGPLARAPARVCLCYRRSHNFQINAASLHLSIASRATRSRTLLATTAAPTVLVHQVLPGPPVLPMELRAYLRGALTACPSPTALFACTISAAAAPLFLAPAARRCQPSSPLISPLFAGPRAPPCSREALRADVVDPLTPECYCAIGAPPPVPSLSESMCRALPFLFMSWHGPKGASVVQVSPGQLSPIAIDDRHHIAPSMPTSHLPLLPSLSDASWCTTPGHGGEDLTVDPPPAAPRAAPIKQPRCSSRAVAPRHVGQPSCLWVVHRCARPG
jgi:hypothetical protein